MARLLVDSYPDKKLVFLLAGDGPQKDNIISLIRGSSDPKDAKNSLINQYKFSALQAKAILDMRLQKLTSLEINKVVEEFNELQVLIKELNEILRIITFYPGRRDRYED